MITRDLEARLDRLDLDLSIVFERLDADIKGIKADIDQLKETTKMLKVDFKGIMSHVDNLHRDTFAKISALTDAKITKLEDGMIDALGDDGIQFNCNQSKALTLIALSLMLQNFLNFFQLFENKRELLVELRVKLLRAYKN